MSEKMWEKVNEFTVNLIYNTQTKAGRQVKNERLGKKERQKEGGGIKWINNIRAVIALLYILSIICTLSCINRALCKAHRYITSGALGKEPVWTLRLFKVCTTSSLSLKAYTAESLIFIWYTEPCLLKTNSYTAKMFNA